MPSNRPVREIMTAEVVTFRTDDPVGDAMAVLLERGIDGAPVLDASGALVGVMTTGDLIVRESRLHFPTVVSILGASLEFKSKDFDADLEKALGSKVGDLMSSPAITVDVDATLGDAATIMHDEKVARLPVVDGDRLVGIVARGDVLRGMLPST
ncbi:MAG: CBS domain-containing protein [Acidimicrobiales bacterium]